jgi:methenyltetrahydromethanopterin cyclohydrolase
MRLNYRATVLARQMIDEAETLRISVHQNSSGTNIVDCGTASPGGLEAGRRMAEICLAGLGQVAISAFPYCAGMLAVSVATDHPIAACMASQYAGWRISVGDYFAMGSGPMRAAAGAEKLFEEIGFQEDRAAQTAVGVLETGQLPPEAACRYMAEACGVPPAEVTLLVAKTASQAGTIQIVARSVETALHKMHELKFDLARIESGFGIAPLPPVAAKTLAAMGRTNDAILYGGEVTLWVRGDDDTLAALGPKIPSSASPDYGRPFAEIFAACDRDFYRIDPHLFAPAVVNLCNLDTGRSFRFGQVLPEMLERSFRG